MVKKELVFVPAPAAGHLVSILEFGNYLIERDKGISVTILLMKVPSAPPIFTASNPNIRIIELPQVTPPEPVVELMKKSIEKSASVFIENHRSVVKEAIINHVLSKSIPLAGLVFDLFCSSMLDVANELGVPSYVFFTSAAAFLRLMLHIPVHYSETGREFSISDSDSIIPGFVNPVPSRVLPSFLFDKDGGYESMMNHALRFKETKGIIINTFAELEPHAIDSLKSDSGTPPIFAVGPLLNLKGQKKPGTDSDSEKIMKWLGNQPPSSVLFLCFGSRGGFEPPQLAEIATALESSGLRFLWSVRQPPSKNLGGDVIQSEVENFSQVLPDGFLERTENRGMVCGWTPQAEVLAHEAVGGFVSHCGWNSILESLWHGVPIATWPIYAEQQMNAFYLVKELALAVELSTDYRMENSSTFVIMADEIEVAIRNLMDPENPIRKRVKEVSEVSRKAVMTGGSSFISTGKFIEEDVLTMNTI